MNRFVQYDKQLEELIKSTVKFNFPVVNSGIIHGSVTFTSSAPATSTIQEADGSSVDNLYIWGTTRWESEARVVAQ